MIKNEEWRLWRMKTINEEWRLLMKNEECWIMIKNEDYYEEWWMNKEGSRLKTEAWRMKKKDEKWLRMKNEDWWMREKIWDFELIWVKWFWHFQNGPSLEGLKDDISEVEGLKDDNSEVDCT